MTHQLSATCKKQCEALGIDWQALLTKFGPIAVQTILSILSALAQPTIQSPAMAKLKAAGDCVPECCGEMLDTQRDDLIEALAANVHLRGCCPCPCPDPTS